MRNLWKSRKYALHFCILFLTLFMISGCASYSKKSNEAILAFRNGDFVTAEEKMSKVLEAEKDSLLRYMELGVIMHEKGDYMESNRLLEKAYLKADNLYGTRIRDLMMRASTNASMLPYKSEIFEKVYIHYYKILNYINLAQTANREEKQQLLDSVLIEGRRAQILLDDHVTQKGTYEEAEDKQGKVINTLMRIFATLRGEVIDPQALVFRDNAFIHYILGVMYEQYGELDNARISYERSAAIYEKGYTQQYHLSPEMADQAKFDAARILKAQRDGRWERVAKTITSNDLKQQLKKDKPGKDGSILILQEVDLSPPKGELNLHMSLNVDTNALSISPILIGTFEEKTYQLSWFYYLYSPKGILNAVEHIQEDGYYNPNAVKAKTINISFLRDTLDEIPGLVEALDVGVRLAVPLLYYDEAPFQSRLTVNNDPAGALMDADSIAGLQMANGLVHAGSELTEAMAIEASRVMTCTATAIIKPAGCSLIAAASAQADTRSWLTLPHTIRIKRLYLPEKEYTIRITSQSGTAIQEQKVETRLKPKDLRILRTRTYFNNLISVSER